MPGAGSYKNNFSLRVAGGMYGDWLRVLHGVAGLEETAFSMRELGCVARL